MERTKLKAINFDLDTNAMKRLGMYPSGYGTLKKTLKKHGFEHRQGSGYVSQKKLDSIMIARIIEQITAEHPWLIECVKKIDVTDIGRQHDLTTLVKAFADTEDIMELSEEEPDEEEDIAPSLIM